MSNWRNLNYEPWLMWGERHERFQWREGEAHLRAQPCSHQDQTHSREGRRIQHRRIREDTGRI